MGTQMIILAKHSQKKPLFFRKNSFTFRYLMYATFRQIGSTSQHILENDVNRIFRWTFIKLIGTKPNELSNIFFVKHPLKSDSSKAARG
jgi:hypothetical protein